MRFRFGDESKIKLIIWDLDDTFWRGTLSDNGDNVYPIASNIGLVKNLAERGIISSICSKNNEDIALQKLAEFGIGEYFVFNSINWAPKGIRIKNTIEAMSLRYENVLFVDDNVSNLAEVEFYMPDIMTATPEMLDYLSSQIDCIGKTDCDLERLNQYKILELKKEDSVRFSSNAEFLEQSGIKIFICEEKDKLIDNIQRISELLQRTNQLNFTKKRIGCDELRALINASDTRCGYIEAKDNYGYYGIIGFYSVSNGDLSHFLFSCRTMGMGIEQYIYSMLYCPHIDIVEPVSGELFGSNNNFDYIERVYSSLAEADVNSNNKMLNILLKGPCDLEVMATYIESGNYEISKEFNFVDDAGLQADFYNHSINILNSIDDQCKRNVLNTIGKYSFLSPQALETDILNPKYDVICLSTLMDATLGVYQRNDQDTILPYGLYNRDICCSDNYEEYANGNVMTAHNKCKASELLLFSEEFTKVEWTPEKIAMSFRRIIDAIAKVNKKARIIILMLPELEYLTKRDYPLKGKETIHIAINKAIREELAEEDRVYLLEVNKYINNQDGYFDSINHYSKMVYYKIAKELSEYISKETETEIATSSKFKAVMDHLRRLRYKKIIKL